MERLSWPVKTDLIKEALDALHVEYDPELSRSDLWKLYQESFDSLESNSLVDELEEGGDELRVFEDSTQIPGPAELVEEEAVVKRHEGQTDLDPPHVATSDINSESKNKDILESLSNVFALVAVGVGRNYTLQYLSNPEKTLETLGLQTLLEVLSFESETLRKKSLSSYRQFDNEIAYRCSLISIASLKEADTVPVLYGEFYSFVSSFVLENRRRFNSSRLESILSAALKC